MFAADCAGFWVRTESPPSRDAPTNSAPGECAILDKYSGPQKRHSRGSCRSSKNIWIGCLSACRLTGFDYPPRRRSFSPEEGVARMKYSHPGPATMGVFVLNLHQPFQTRLQHGCPFYRIKHWRPHRSLPVAGISLQRRIFKKQFISLQQSQFADEPFLRFKKTRQSKRVAAANLAMIPMPHVQSGALPAHGPCRCFRHRPQCGECAQRDLRVAKPPRP